MVKYYAGTDLIRRVKGETAYGMTFTLLTTSEGNKMGKTKSGAVWLDANKTSFEFYQYWRNVADMDVKNCLSLLTFLSMDEVERLGSLEGAEINKAKEILAFEVTKLVHGEEEAKKADKAAKALFGEGAMGGSIPSTTIPKAEFVEGMDIITLLSKVGLIPSRGEGRRLIQQGGITINDGRVSDISTLITLDFFENDTLMIRKGKKTYHQVVLDDNKIRWTTLHPWADRSQSAPTHSVVSVNPLVPYQVKWQIIIVSHPRPYVTISDYPLCPISQNKFNPVFIQLSDILICQFLYLCSYHKNVVIILFPDKYF